jgi:pyruvate,water dikinase
MDLALWQTAVSLKSAPQLVARFQTSEACELSRSYQQGILEAAAQKAIGNFLERYGGRGPGEVDLGKKRWSEDPTPVMQALQSYLKISDPELAPDTVFARGVEKAEKAAEALSAAVARLPFGWLKVRLLRFAISRFRALAGMREAPKFFAVRMMSIIRQALLRSGEAMAAAGMLERPDDLFFLRSAELHEIASSRTIPKEYRPLMDARRKIYTLETRRPRLPLVLLHDGTTFYPGVSRHPQAAHDAKATILGEPVSPGTAEGRVRVVLNPHQSNLQPGEILVCAGTDPSWTPLFLAAAGLVMEVGGLMTHGSVVAREYGIPAIVGVVQATTRLKTGMLIRLDGTNGCITVLDENRESFS